MKYIKLFEEFNPYTGKVFAEKMRLYAEASEYVVNVSKITELTDAVSFTISTEIPTDFQPTGKKTFKVIIPTDIENTPYVETYENNKLVLTTSLEAKGENDIELILINFIEATGLFDDTVIQAIVDKHDKIKTVADIKHLIAQCNSSYKKKYEGH